MTTIEIYSERASQCRDEAAAAVLDNVKDRCLRSAYAWEGMVDQLRVTEAYRANEAVRKAEAAMVPDRQTYLLRD
jgi:hypothetical protein